MPNQLIQMLCKARSQRPLHWLLAAEAWLQLLATHAMVSWLPARWWTPVLRERCTSSADRESPLSFHNRERSLAMAMNTAAHHHFRPMTCLRRSLALQAMLARRGRFATLRLGFRKSEGTLTAHAWLELDSRVINDSPTIAQQFAPLHVDPPTLTPEFSGRLGA